MGGRILMSHDSPRYRQKWNRCGRNKYNGALYYSKEIVKNIIPRVSTDRTWITVNMPGVACNHSIVFVHNNLHPENYDWLTQYKDVVLVCGVPETCEKVAHIGTPIYLPLSVDVEEVGKYHCTKTKEAAFAGRPTKRTAQLPAGIDYLEGLPRREMLARMAEYKKIYAVGRTAIEAKALGCEVLPYDERYPDTSRWQVLDNSEAAEILQRELDRIDHPERLEPEEEPEPVEMERPKRGATKAELVAYAGLCGVHITSRMTKAEILQKLSDAGRW